MCWQCNIDDSIGQRKGNSDRRRTGNATAWKVRRQHDSDIRHNGDGRHTAMDGALGAENGANWGGIIEEVV